MGSSGRVRGLNLATYTRSGPGFAVVEHTQSAGGVGRRCGRVVTSDSRRDSAHFGGFRNLHIFM